MGTIGNLIVNIGAKIDGLKKGLSDSTDLVQGAKSKFQSLGSGIGAVLKAGAAVGVGALLAVGAGVVTLGPMLVGLGSDAEEMMGKFNVVFAQSGAEVEASLTQFGAAVGRNKFELMGYAATLGDTLKPMGFTEQAAASMSVEMVKLATDLSSFNNMPMDEALQRLQGTLIGNHENALAFGVIINENTLKAELAANGWDKLTGAALEQAKAQARMNLLMKGTTDAQGDAARTSGSWANQMRALQATLTQTGTEIGLKLLPVITPLLTKMGALAREFLPLVAEWFSRVVEKLVFLGEVVQNGGIGSLFKVFEDGSSYIGAFLETLGLSEPVAYAIGNAIANLGSTILTWITGTGLPALQQFGTWFVNEGWPAIQLFAGQILSQLVPGLMQLWTWGSQIAAVALPLLGQAIQFVIDHFNIFGPILAVIGVAILAIASPVTLVIGLIVLLATAWANNWGGIQQKTQAVIDFIWPYIQAAMTGIQQTVVTVLTYIQTWWQQHGASVMTIVQFFMNVILGIILVVAGLIQLFWAAWGDELLTIATAAWDNIKIIVDSTMQQIGFIIDAIAALIRGDWQAFGDALQNIWRTAWDGMKAALTNAKEALMAALKIVTDALKAAWETFTSGLSTAWNSAWDAAADKIESIKGTISGIIEGIISKINELISAINSIPGLPDLGGVGGKSAGPGTKSFPGAGLMAAGGGTGASGPVTEIHLHYYGSAPGNPVQDVAMLQALAVT